MVEGKTSGHSTVLGFDVVEAARNWLTRAGWHSRPPWDYCTSAVRRSTWALPRVIATSPPVCLTVFLSATPHYPPKTRRSFSKRRCGPYLFSSASISDSLCLDPGSLYDMILLVLDLCPFESP